MKVDRSKLKRNHEHSGETAVASNSNQCQAFVAKLRNCTWEQFGAELSAFKSWGYSGKIDLCQWIDILDRCDEILEKATEKAPENTWTLTCDKPENVSMKPVVREILRFLTLLFDNTFSRHWFSSIDRLTALLDSSDIAVIVAVLQLLYVIAKKTQYLSKLNQEQRSELSLRLVGLAEKWGGKDEELSLADCCREKNPDEKGAQTDGLAKSVTSVYLQYYSEEGSAVSETHQSSARILQTIHIDELGEKMPGAVMDSVLRNSSIPIPKKERVSLMCRLRLAASFPHRKTRLLCVMARCQATSILMYGQLLQESQTNSIVYNGFIEELTEVLKLPDDPSLDDVKTEILKTLTATVYLDRNPKLHLVVEATGANSYHGFIPSLMRQVIQSLIRTSEADASTSSTSKASTQFAIALFSFVYHMAIYDGGAEPLVASGMLESLLSVVNWTESPIESITFVTRSVRVIDLIASLDSQMFQSLNGIGAVINRLVLEIGICRNEQPFEIPSPAQVQRNESGSQEGAAEHMDVDSSQHSLPSGSSLDNQPSVKEPIKGLFCHPQRSALLKSLLNLVKRAIQDTQLSDTARHIMDGPFPGVIKHIVSNPEYYGSALFLNAINVVTQFIYQEPGQLTSLQDKGLTHVIMQTLLVREVPASREVLASLPSTFAALCLNERGLQAFMGCDPFEKLFNVLLSTKYLPAMKRRRTTDPLGDTAMNLGAAVDELMRHQPALKPGAMQAVVKLLKSLCEYGSDPKYDCVAKWGSKAETPTEEEGSGPEPLPVAPVSHQASSNESSDEEDEDDDSDSRPSAEPSAAANEVVQSEESEPRAEEKKVEVPLLDYIGNVMKFIEAILSNNATDDHAKLFVQHGGVEPLARLVVLPNLSAEFGQSTAFNSVASAVRYIVTQARDASIVEQLFKQLNEDVLPTLKPLLSPMDSPGGSRLVEDALRAAEKLDSSGVAASLSSGQLMRGLGMLHTHLLVLGHVAKIGQSIQQNELKTLLLSKWTSDPGKMALAGLQEIHRALVWESAVMLTLADSSTPADGTFACVQIRALQARGGRRKKMKKLGEGSSSGSAEPMEVDEKKPEEASSSSKGDPAKNQSGLFRNRLLAESGVEPAVASVIQELKPVVSASSKVGRQLSDLLTVLMKSCLGGTTRVRRGQNPFILPPTPQGLQLTGSLCAGFRDTFVWNPAGDNTPMKLRMTYLICVVAIVSPLLFDERKQSYHLVLQKFFSSGCQKAFFDCISGVLAEMNGETIPSGVEEFLESWLILLEKLVNPQNILESQNKLVETPSANGQSAANTAAFDPVRFLMATQKKELEKGNEEEKKSGEDRRRELEEEIDPTLLQALVDMGFSRNVAVDALLLTNSLEGATEWLLSHPQGRQQMPGQQGLNVLMDEEEQLQQAIAMSLEQEGNAQDPDQNENAAEEPASEENAENTPSDGGNPGRNPRTELGEESDSAGTTDGNPTADEGGAMADVSSSEGEPPRFSAGSDTKEMQTERTEKAEFLEESTPLDPEALLQFAGKEILPQCLLMIDENPGLVYRCADLMSVAVKVMGSEWTRETLLKECLIGEARVLAKLLLGLCEKQQKEWTESKQAASLNSRLHLLCLLLTEMKESCCEEAEKCGFEEILIDLLGTSACAVQKSENKKLPKFLSPLLLWLDLYEKIAVASKRKNQVRESGLKFTWKYWDNRQWSSFTPAVTQQIREAYEKGEQTVRFTVQRRRYTVDFGNMTQMNLDSGYTRPTLMIPLEEKESEEKTEKSEAKEEPGAIQPPQLELASFSVEQSAKIVRSCVEMMSSTMEGDTLHSVLRLCLRLTRHSGVAADFMNLGGLQKILDLRQNQSFTGMPAIVSLLVRHVLEDDSTLKHTMEKVVRAVAQGAQHTPGQLYGQPEEQQRQPPEFHYAMRALGPVAARRPDLFCDVVKRVVRLKLPAPRPDEVDRDAPAEGPLELRVEGTAAQAPLKMSNSLEQVLALLLNYVGSDFGQNRSVGIVIPEKMDTDESKRELKEAEDMGISGKKAENDAQCSLPLVQKSAVLKMLAELIRSYSSVAGYVAQYRYKQEGTEDCSALSYVLDNLLHPVAKTDAELLGAVRTFVATLAAANHCPESQTALVLEVKAALGKAVSLPESQAKHQKIVALASLISLMRESCPNVPVQGQPPGSKSSPLSTNGILQRLVKRKVVSDLSRIPLYIDLSSTQAVSTVNAVLKVLEELTRLINSPSGTVTSSTSATLDSSGRTIGGSTQIQQNHTGPLPNSENTAGENERTLVTEGNASSQNPSGENGMSDSQDNRTSTEVQVNTETPVATLDVDSSSLSEPTHGHETRQNVAEADEMNAVRDSAMPPHSHVHGEVENSTSSEDEDDTPDDDDDDESGSDNEMDATQMNGEETGNDAGSEHSDYELGEDAEDEVTELDVDMDEDDEASDFEADIRGEIGQMNVEEEMLDVMGEVFRSHFDQRETAGLPAGLQEALAAQGFGGGGPTSVRLIVPAGRGEDFNIGINLLGGRGQDTAGTAAASSSAGTSGAAGISNHPLLTRPAEAPAAASTVATGNQTAIRTVPRILFPGGMRHHGGLHRQGAVRQRGYRFFMQPNNNTDQGVFRRLFGPDAEEIVMMTRGLGGNEGAATGRFVITDEDLRSNGLLQDDWEDSASSRNTIVSVPSALSRWTEESRLLDGESVHHLVASLKPELEAELKRYRQMEFEERRKQLEAQRKEAVESMPPPPKEEVNSSALSSADESRESSMDSADQGDMTRAFMSAMLGLSTSGAENRERMRESIDAAASAVADEILQASMSSAVTTGSEAGPRAEGSLTVTSTETDTAAPNEAIVGSAETAEEPNNTDPSQDSEEVVPELMQIEQDPFSNITNASSVTINSSDGEGQTGEERHMNGEAEGSRVVGEQQNEGNERVAEETSETPAEEQERNADNERERERRQAEIETYRHLLGDIDIPDGVDVSFLAALPESMRQEVIEDHLRQQRVRRMREQNQPPAAAAAAAAPAQGAPSSGETAQAVDAAAANGTEEIAPEFLDALPPEIQEEVLNAQRLRQATNNPPPEVEAMDPATFMETLPPSLRRQILADADDSQLQALPAHIVREAQTLRAQLEQRTLNQARQFPYMDIFGDRHAYHVRQQQQRAVGQWTGGFGARTAAMPFGTMAGTVAVAQTVRGQQLLDREALSGLLVLFFMDDQRLNIGRLHRILKSLCFHPGTRDWLVRALISILEQVEKSLKCTGKKTDRHSLSSSAVCIDGVYYDTKQPTQSWLNLTTDTGLGNRANVFEIERKQQTGKKVSSVMGAPGPKETILIHKLVSSAVCRHVLDCLISLAKGFPGQFVPNTLRSAEASSDQAKDKCPDGSTDFWSILLRLDSGMGTSVVSTPTRPTSAKSRSSSRTGSISSVGLSEEAFYGSFDEAPLGRLMAMLNHSVISDANTLLDRLLRLLSSVVMALPDSSASRLKSTDDGASKELEESVLDEQLRLVVAVVTRGKCSEDGLQDGRNLLLESVRAFGRGTRHAVIKLLFGAAQKLGEELGDKIRNLLEQLATLPKSSVSDEQLTPSTSGMQTQARGVVQDRYEGSAVIISGKSLAKAVPALSSCAELQLSAVGALTAKNSVQNFLLRTLNTLIQVREAVKARDKQLKEQAKRERLEKEKREAEEKKKQEREERERARTEAEETVNGETGAPQSNTDGSAEAMDTAEPQTQSTESEKVGVSETKKEEEEEDSEKDPLEMCQLSELLTLDPLWEKLSNCLKRLGEASDQHAVLILQPAAESFFLVHATQQEKDSRDSGEQQQQAQSGAVDELQPSSPQVLAESAATPSIQTEMSSYMVAELPPDTQKLVKFAEDHRRVLNQILRQSNVPLTEGPFSVLIDYPKLLDFDVKRKYFKKELARLDDRTRYSRRDDVPLRVRRNQVFQESFRELFRLRPAEWKNRFFVIFEGEEGQDAGGLLREWFTIITREIFNPNYALFATSPGDRVTYMINPASYVNREHLDYFKFVGHFIGKAVYDGKLLECYFTRAFYKHILNKPVRYQDLESEDPSYFKSLEYVKENPVDMLGLDLRFSVEVEEFGVREVRDLKPDGRSIPVTDDTKEEYIRLVCQMKMTGAIRKQLQAFLEGFYDIIPKKLISVFNEQELELLISGLPNIDVDDLQQHTDYHKYTKNSLQIQWFWRALRSFDQEDRAKFLQFLTGTSKVPLQGFANLEGMNGVQKFSIHRDDRSTVRLPTAHTCFNQLDLPVYESYDKLRSMLLIAIHECAEGFGFA